MDLTQLLHWYADAERPPAARTMPTLTSETQLFPKDVSDSLQQRAEGDIEEQEWARVLLLWAETTNEPVPASWLLENVFEPCEPLAHISIKGQDAAGRARSLSRVLGKEVGRPRALPDGRIARIEKSYHAHTNRDLFVIRMPARREHELNRASVPSDGSDAGAEPAPPAIPFQLPPDWRDWPEDWRVAFEERAAIREFDGGQPRDVAEREAKAEILRTAAAETSRDERKTA